jgi:hypothetical protein
MRHQKRMIPKSGNRFAAVAKPASAGEGRSEEIMRRPKRMIPKSGNRFSEEIMRIKKGSKE